MPPEDKFTAKTKGFMKSSYYSAARKRRQAQKAVLTEKDLQGLLKRQDIEVEVHNGKLVVRRKEDNRLLRLVKTQRGIKVVDPTKVSKAKPFIPGITLTPVQQPELSGLRRAKPVPRVTQPAGTEPEPPKASPSKKKWLWSSK